MTRKDNKELVNRVKLRDGEQWYTDEELQILASLGILCEELQFHDNSKKEPENVQELI
jgi:hypothetical protein